MYANGNAGMIQWGLETQTGALCMRVRYVGGYGEVDIFRRNGYAKEFCDGTVVFSGHFPLLHLAECGVAIKTSGELFCNSA